MIGRELKAVPILPPRFSKRSIKLLCSSPTSRLSTNVRSAPTPRLERRPKSSSIQMWRSSTDALRALTDARVLMIQNVHYGDREELPFDLKHKAGPIQFRLAPDATKAIIDAEHVRLRTVLVDALRPYVGTAASAGAAAPKFEEF